MKVTFDFAQAQPWDGGQNLDSSPDSQLRTASLAFPQSSWNHQEDCGLGRGVIRDTQMNLGLQVPAEPLDATALGSTTQRILDSCQFEQQWPGKPFPAHSHGIPKPDISTGLGKRQISRDLVSLERFLIRELTLMYYQNRLCHFKKICWKKLDNHQAVVLFKATLQKAGLADSLTDSDYRKLVKMVSESPEIQCEEELQPPPYTINFLDGTLNLETGQLYPHDPGNGFFRVVKLSYREICAHTSEGTVFESFLRQVSDGDPEVRQQLLELIALVLSEANLKYFYVLLGPSNTGKSQIGKFLEELVGEENVVTIRGMHDFSSQWTTGSMQGKRLASCLDLPDKPLPEDAAGIIKQLVGDDTVKVEEKYKSPGVMRKKPILFFAGNYPMRGKTLDEAILNRMVIIPFSNPCPVEEMKQGLHWDFLEESPYIIAQAIDAFQALMQRNFQVTRARVPEAYLPQIGDDKTRTIKEFVNRCCELQEKSETATRDLWGAFCHFCETKGSPAMTDIDFPRQFKELIRMDNLPIVSVKRVNGSGPRGYQGIRILPEFQSTFAQE